MEPLLRLENITKVYPGVVANRNISFKLNKGEIHAICGENGAGKSTLMKILFGMERPSDGQIYFKGKPVHITSPQAAIDLGIGMVHQHFMLVPSFTVAENLVLGIEPSKLTKIDKKDSVAKTLEISEKFNLEVIPEAKVEDITVGMMQKLEILKALYRGAKILILDEPTAVLTPQETEELFEELIQLRDRGHTIVFISHKLKEIKSISNMVTVIRRGELVGSFKTEDVTEEQISEYMIGKIIFKREQTEKVKNGDPVLNVKNLTLVSDSGKKLLDNVNFNLRKGEILGIAGVEGNGQNELVKILTGQLPFSDGSVVFGNYSINAQGIHNIRSLGVSFIPEDRMKDGCAVKGSVWENLMTNRIDNKEFSRRTILNRKALKDYSELLVKDYDILCSNIDTTVSLLSGGNIQKVVVARECSNDPSLLIADQPTRGVDVGAANRIHEKIRELTQKETAVILVSADLTELLEVSTSLIVFFEGRITAWFTDIAQLNENELGLFMLGIKNKESQGE